MTRDWGLPVALAVGAAVVGIAMNYVAEVFILIGAAIASPSNVPVGTIVKEPLVAWSGFHGAVEGFHVLVTGLAWILVAFLLARRLLAARWTAARDLYRADRTLLARRAVKAGLAYMIIVVAVSSVSAAINSPPLSGQFFRLRGPAGILSSPFGDVNVAAAVLLGFSVGAVAALITLVRAARMPAATLLGLRTDLPRPAWLPAALAGGRKTLLVGIGGMALFFYGGTVLQLIDLFDQGPRAIAATSITLIPWFLGRAIIDVGGIFLVNSMRFFAGESVVLPFGKPGWLYLSCLIAAAAFFLGGLRAARTRQPTDSAGAARAGATTLLLVVPSLFVASLFWSGESGDDIIAAALLLPVLWGVLAALGGLYHANQAGLPPGIQLQAGPSLTADSPRCPSCSEPVAPTAAFCSACGTRLKRA